MVWMTHSSHSDFVDGRIFASILGMRSSEYRPGTSTLPTCTCASPGIYSNCVLHLQPPPTTIRTCPVTILSPPHLTKCSVKGHQKTTQFQCSSALPSQ